MKTTLLIFLFAISGIANAQTIISATPVAALQGDFLEMTVTTSSPVGNPYSIKLINGSKTISPFSANNTTGNVYQVGYIIREYELPGNYTLTLGSSTFSTPVVISKLNYSEVFNYNSVKSININVSDVNKDGIKKIATDKQGNIYCVGTFYGTSTIGSQTLTAKGKRDGFAAKYNSAGSLIWVKTIGSSSDDGYYFFEGMTSLKIFNDTMVYISGFFVCDTTLKFNNTTPLSFPARNKNSQDGVLIKLDSAGNFIWSAFQGSKKEDATNDLEIDNSGNILLTGYLQGDLSKSQFSNDTCYTYVYSSGLTDSISLKAYSGDYYGIFIAKYSPTGNLVWAKRQDRDYFVWGGNPKAIKLTSNNSIVIVSWTQGSVTYDNVTCSNASCCNGHYIVMKTDSAGNRLWCKEVGNFANVFTLGVDQWDNIYVPNTTAWNYGDGAFLKKYDMNGNEIWNKQLHSNKSNSGLYTSVTDKLGNTYVAFNYQDAWATNNYSIILKKIDAAGNIVASTYPSPYNANSKNAPTAITLNNAGNKIYLAGNYMDSQTFGTTNINASTAKVFLNELNFSLATGINNEYFSLDKSNTLIFPNPFSVQTTLQTDKTFTDATMSVYNSLGQQVKQIKNISGQTITFHRDNLSQGLYFIRLTQDNKTFITEKLIITD